MYAILPEVDTDTDIGLDLKVLDLVHCALALYLKLWEVYNTFIYIQNSINMSKNMKNKQNKNK